MSQLSACSDQSLRIRRSESGRRCRRVHSWLVSVAPFLGVQRWRQRTSSAGHDWVHTGGPRWALKDAWELGQAKGECVCMGGWRRAVGVNPRGMEGLALFHHRPLPVHTELGHYFSCMKCPLFWEFKTRLYLFRKKIFQCQITIIFEVHADLYRIHRVNF